MTPEQEIADLDRFLDALQSGVAFDIDAGAEPGLADLANTVLELRRLAEPAWPDDDYPTRASANIAAVLRTRAAKYQPSSAGPMPLNGRPPALPDDSTPKHLAGSRHRRRWFKELGQMAAAALTVVLVAGLLVLLLGNVDGSRFGSGSSQPTGEPSSLGQIGVPAKCPVTTTPSPPFIPPAPYASTPYPDLPGNDDFWYGSPQLWTFLQGDGSLTALHDASDYTFRMLWFSQNYNFRQAQTAQTQPSITFTGIRLDGPAASLKATTSNAFSAEFQSFMFAGFSVSTPGCWKITGDYEGNTLSVVVWVTQQTPGTPTSATSTPVPQADTSAGRIYLQAGNSIDILDAGSGRLLHQLPLHLATQGVFLATDFSGLHLFVTDAPTQNGQAVDELTVYNTADWSVERQVPVPDIIRTLGDGSAIAASTDGQYVYVYNDNDRTRGSEPVKYWLATLDVASGKWLGPTVDLPSCGVSQLMTTDLSGLVYVRCGDTGDLRVIDPIAGRVIRSIPGIASVIANGQSVYAVGSDGSVQILDNASGSDGVTPQSSTASASLSVPSQPVGVTPGGSEIFIPSGTAAEVKQGLASAIAVVNSHTGAVLRTFGTSQPFRSAAFSPDGSAAYLELVGSSGDSQTLARLDLNTGKETTLFQGEIATNIVVAP